MCIVFLLSIALVACGSGDSKDDESAKDNDTTEDTANDAAADDDTEESSKENDTEESSNGDEAAVEENDTEEESDTDSEENADNEAAAETPEFNFDPNGENTVTLQLEQAGVIVKLTYKADGDMVYEQTADNEMLYSAIGVTTPEEAEEIMADVTAEYQEVEGVTHNIEYLEDKMVESLTVNFEEADLNEVGQLTGSEFEGNVSNGISLQQSVQMLLDQGYEIVEE